MKKPIHSNSRDEDRVVSDRTGMADLWDLKVILVGNASQGFVVRSPLCVGGDWVITYTFQTTTKQSDQ